MSEIIRVGLLGYGKAGQAVASVLEQSAGFQLCWIARGRTLGANQTEAGTPIWGLDKHSLADLQDKQAVDALVDFSVADSLYQYGDLVRKHGLMLVSAISAYSATHLEYAQRLGEYARVLCSPNITLGINFLIIAARLLRKIAPFADVEILEQHFRQKPEISGTARKIASELDVTDSHITSLRLGGIVGHHEVIFGFPHQTVRITHESIRREAFGTGVVFALSQLAQHANGFYTFDELLQNMIQTEFSNAIVTEENHHEHH